MVYHYIVYTNFGSLETGRAAGLIGIIQQVGALDFSICLNVHRNFSIFFAMNQSQQKTHINNRTGPVIWVMSV